MGREERLNQVGMKPGTQAPGKFNVLITVTYLDGESVEYECHSWTDTPTTLALEFFNHNLRVIPHTSIMHFDVAPLANREEKSVIVQ